MKIVNRKAYHDYTVIKEFTAGIALVGSEVKSLRNGEANLQDSFCYSMDGEIFVKGLHISKNKMSSFTNHEEKRDRKLLLTKREIRNIINEVKTNNGMTVVPLEIFELKGRFKIKICIAKGKKTYDKRESIKRKDIDREIRNDY
jgi:SsrA-binding protein